MRITVEGSIPGATQEFWSVLEKAIGALLGEAGGGLTRIARPDGNANYRAHGVYELTYSAPWVEHTITLELK